MDYQTMPSCGAQFGRAYEIYVIRLEWACLKNQTPWIQTSWEVTAAVKCVFKTWEKRNRTPNQH